MRFREMKIKRIMAMLLLPGLLLLPARPAAAEAAQSSTQWVYLLPAPDDEGSCTFFVNPSLGGYPAGEGTDVSLTMAVSDKSYDVDLSSEGARSGWYASPAYAIAKSVWKSDYEITVRLTENGETAAETTLTNKETRAAWPETAGGEIRLERDKNGVLKNNRFALDKYAGEITSSLFVCGIEDAENCTVTLDGSEIVIGDAGKDAAFTLTVTDPAGAKRSGKVTIKEGKAFQLPKGPLAAAVIIILAGAAAATLLKRKRRQEEARILALQGELEAKKESVRKALNAADNAWDGLDKSVKTAREHIRRQEESGIYDEKDVDELVSRLGAREENASYTALKEIQQELKVQLQAAKDWIGHFNGPGGKGPDEKYLDPEKREEIFDKIGREIMLLGQKTKDIQEGRNWLGQLILSRSSSFMKDIHLKLTDERDGRTMEGLLVAMEYGVALPGVYDLDQMMLNNRSGMVPFWQAAGGKTLIRICAANNSHYKLVAAEPVIFYEGEARAELEIPYGREISFTINKYYEVSLKS